MISSSKNFKVVVITVSLAFSSSLFAGGFQLWEQDVSDLGDYHAGAAAEADSAGVEFYNPAGITRLDKQQISFGAALVGLEVSYTGTANGSLVNNAPGDTFNWVPNFHYVLPLPHNLWFSFGETTPFGLSTDYDENSSPVNALATETKLATFNLNPSLAYKVNRYLSLAAGFDALRGSADYNTVVYSFYPASSDLAGWGYGYNAGALIQFTPATRMGLSYRSAIEVNASGDSSSVSASPGASINTDANAVLDLPATSILTLYHDFGSRFSMMGSAFYTQWSSFRQLLINNMATPIGTTNLDIFENYRNTWNFALGGKYRFNKFLSMEAGFGHDETPTRIGYRDIRLPDNNRYAASLGLNIQPKPGFVWSMGWTHFFVPSTAIDNSNSDASGQTGVSIGTETGNINVIGTQFSVVI